MLEKRHPGPCKAWILSEQGPSEDPVDTTRTLDHCEDSGLEKLKSLGGFKTYKLGKVSLFHIYNFLTMLKNWW